MSCPNFWRKELPHGAASLTNGTQLTLLVNCAVNKKKKATRMREIKKMKKATNYPSRPVHIYIYIYIYICIYI